MKHLKALDSTRQALTSEQYQNTFRNLTVHYLWGKTGVGKTRFVMEKYGYENVYRVTNYAHPFDSYHSEPVILFDEFRSDLPLKDMLKYLDGYIPFGCPAAMRIKLPATLPCISSAIFRWTNNIQMSSKMNRRAGAHFFAVLTVITWKSWMKAPLFPLRRCPMFNEYPDIMTVSKLQMRCISAKTQHALIRQREIGSKRIGRKIIVPKSCLIDYVQSARYHCKTVTADKSNCPERSYPMTGSLQIKNEKFYIVLNITENGKRKQKWIATGLPTKKEINARQKSACTKYSAIIILQVSPQTSFLPIKYGYG